MSSGSTPANPSEAAEALRRGDFSRLTPLFENDSECAILRWIADGSLSEADGVLHEALTCACWHGLNDVADRLQAAGADLSAGDGTGFDALHWSVNRGHLQTVRFLLDRGASTETRSRFGGTALDTAVWSMMNERQPSHLRIIEVLVDAGADVDAVQFFPGTESIRDAVLARRSSTT